MTAQQGLASKEGFRPATAESMAAAALAAVSHAQHSQTLKAIGRPDLARCHQRIVIRLARHVTSGLSRVNS